MFRDLKEYQNLKKLYEEKVSKPENLVENERGSAFANNNTKIKTREQVGLKNNIKLNDKKIDTSFDSSKIIKNAIEKKNNLDNKTSNSSGLNLKDMQRYSNNREVTMKDFTPPPEKKVEIKKDPEPEVKTTPVVSDKTKQGKPRTKAQMMAAKRIASGKTIADVKQSNQDSMRAKAKARFAAFKAKRAEKNLDKQRDFDDPDKKMNRGESYTPYDMVLEYLLSSEQAATIEEANYVMTEMDAETIQGIVEEQKKNLNEISYGRLAKVVVPAAAGLGLLGQLGKKDPVGNSRQDFQMDYKLKKLSGTGDSPNTRTMLGIPLDYKLSDEQKKKYNLK